MGETNLTVPPPGKVGVVGTTASRRTIRMPEAPGPPMNLCGENTMASMGASGAGVMRMSRYGAPPA